MNIENISSYSTKILETYQRAITKELEKRSGSELKAIKKQLAKLAEMTGMKIVEEETEGSPPKEENELAVTASEETPTKVPQSAEPIEAPSPTEGKGEEAGYLWRKRKRGILSQEGGRGLGKPLIKISPQAPESLVGESLYPTS
jgi:hypothetical protein